MIEALRGKIQTVTGPIEPDDLGVTLIHEHLYFDLTCYYQPPQDEKGERLTDQELSLSNLGWVRNNTMTSRPNLRSYDDDVIASEVELYMDLGGRAMVDCTINGIEPNPAGLRRISQRTGLHVIAGSGYYIYPSHPPDMDSKTIEDIQEEIVGDLTRGGHGTDVLSGLIGELGASWPLHPNEEKTFRAGARAHLETGAPISVHPGHDPDSPLSLIELLKEEGVQPDRVIMSHIENRYREDLDRYKRWRTPAACWDSTLTDGTCISPARAASIRPTTSETTSSPPWWPTATPSPSRRLRTAASSAIWSLTAGTATGTSWRTSCPGSGTWGWTKRPSTRSWWRTPSGS